MPLYVEEKQLFHLTIIAWVTVKFKYDDIAQLFISNYPKEKSGEFPNSDILDAFNKNRISAKIKKLKMGYKKAIDSGRKRVRWKSCWFTL